MISVVLLGAGNVGQHLYEAIKKSSRVEVTQWYNRDISKLQMFKNEIEISNSINDLKEADIYIIAVSDDAIKSLAQQLPFKERLVVHTSGMTSIHDIDKSLYRGVFYPLQSFTKGRSLDFKKVPICLEALEKQHYIIMQELANALGSKTYKISTDQRKTLHLSAVFVNNFGNQLYRIAHEISDAKNINFDILKPLISETAAKINEMSPYMAQTGPAVRGDKKTLKRHLKELEDSPHKKVYELMTESIKKTHGKR